MNSTDKQIIWVFVVMLSMLIFMLISLSQARQKQVVLNKEIFGFHTVINENDSMIIKRRYKDSVLISETTIRK